MMANCKERTTKNGKLHDLIGTGVLVLGSGHISIIQYSENAKFLFKIFVWSKARGYTPVNIMPSRFS